MTAKIGDERYLLEYIGVEAWHTKAKEAGWDGQDESFDALRPYCEPEQSATYVVFKDLKAAAAHARSMFKAKPRDSVYGAIIIEQQTLEAAQDDSGNLIPGCKPEWLTQQSWEVTADGAILNCGWPS